MDVPGSRARPKVLHRRMFLKAIALGASAPVAMRLARVATAATTPAPKRLFLFFTPHGVAPEHYAPRIVGSDLTNFALDQTNVSILGPLQPYQPYVNVYQGFQYPGAAATHTGIVNCLSGTTLDRHHDGADLDGARHRQGAGHFAAHPGRLLAPALRARQQRHVVLGRNARRPAKSPVAAADALFGGSTTPPPANADVQLRQDLLAFTASEIQTLQSSLTGLTRSRPSCRPT